MRIQFIFSVECLDLDQIDIFLEQVSDLQRNVAHSGPFVFSKVLELFLWNLPQLYILQLVLTWD